MKYNSNDNGYVLLAGAILNQAKEEYLYALLTGDSRNIKYYEDYFKSEWVELLSLGHGDAIIAYTRNQAETGDLFLSIIAKAVRLKFGVKYNLKKLVENCKLLGIPIKMQKSFADKINYVYTINAKDLPRLYDYISNNL